MRRTLTNGLFLTFAATIAMVAAPTFAHETWILPASGSISATGWIPVSISSGMDFPKPDTALPHERLERSGVRLAGSTRRLEALGSVGGALLARANLPVPGVATIWMEIAPLEVALTPAQVIEYFDEIQADPELRKAWDPAAGRPWRERYAKFAKVFVGVGGFERDRSWAEPIGGALEIVPETNPSGVAGEPVTNTLTVRVLKDGNPLPNLPLAVQADGARRWQRTDGDGRARLQLIGSGPWLIHGTQLIAPVSPDEPWLSWFTTLTILR